MVKFVIAYLGIMLVLYGSFFGLKNIFKTPEQKKILRDTIVTIATLMTVTAFILAVIVVLF